MAKMSKLAQEGFEVFKNGGIEALHKWLESLSETQQIELTAEGFESFESIAEFLFNGGAASHKDDLVAYINPPGRYWEN